MTPVEFRLDDTAIIQASRLHLSRYRAVFIGFILFLALVAASPALFLIDRLSAGQVLLRALQNMAPTLGIAVVLFLALHYGFFPFLARRNYRQQKALAETMALSWTEDEFCYTTGKSRTEIPFADLYGYRMSEDLILLYRTNVLYHLVPRAALGSAAADFVQRLDQAGIRHL